MASLFQIIGLFVLAATGSFTIVTVAILRCSCEAVLMLDRIVFVRLFWREYTQAKAEGQEAI